MSRKEEISERLAKNLPQKTKTELSKIPVDKKDIKLNITTNGTKFTRRFLDKISVFQEVRFNISVDGYGPTYEYIRYPFKWDKFTQRQNELNGYKDVFKWSYTCVPQMYNIENLHKLQQYCESINSTLYMNNILHPDGIFNSLDIVPNHILQYAIDNIKLNSLKKAMKLVLKNREPEIIESFGTLVTKSKLCFLPLNSGLGGEWKRCWFLKRPGFLSLT